MQAIYDDLYKPLLPPDHVRVSRKGLNGPTVAMYRTIATSIGGRAAYCYAAVFKAERVQQYLKNGLGHKDGKDETWQVFGAWLGDSLAEVLADPDDDDNSKDDDDDNDDLVTAYTRMVTRSATAASRAATATAASGSTPGRSSASQRKAATGAAAVEEEDLDENEEGDGEEEEEDEATDGAGNASGAKKRGSPKMLPVTPAITAAIARILAAKTAEAERAKVIAADADARERAAQANAPPPPPLPLPPSPPPPPEDLAVALERVKWRQGRPMTAAQAKEQLPAKARAEEAAAAAAADTKRRLDEAQAKLDAVRNRKARGKRGGKAAKARKPPPTDAEQALTDATAAHTAAKSALAAAKLAAALARTELANLLAVDSAFAACDDAANRHAAAADAVAAAATRTGKTAYAARKEAARELAAAVEEQREARRVLEAARLAAAFPPRHSKRVARKLPLLFLPFVAAAGRVVDAYNDQLVRFAGWAPLPWDGACGACARACACTSSSHICLVCTSTAFPP